MLGLPGYDAWKTRAPESPDNGDCDNEVLKECPTCEGEGEVPFLKFFKRTCPECKGAGETEQECGGNRWASRTGAGCDSCDWEDGPDFDDYDPFDDYDVIDHGGY